MEAISSLELKDLFRKCPRLKSKLSGQELRAISDIIDQRVRIQHSQLLIKIARLEMYQSAFDKRKALILKSDEERLASPKHSLEMKGKKNWKCQDHSKTYRPVRVTFTLPCVDKDNDSSPKNNRCDSKDSISKKTALKESSKNCCTDRNPGVFGTCSVKNEDVLCEGDIGMSKSETKQNTEDVLVTNVTQKIVSYPMSLPTSLTNEVISSEWCEEIKKRDTLIKNLTKEIDFYKTILNERSDYEQILQESLRQQRLINQLKIELNSKGKDNLDLMKDIERMRYAMSCKDHTCHGLNDEPPNAKSRDSQLQDNKKGTGFDRKSGCCDSVLISSRYLFMDCANTANCPWRKQLASCRSILSKKYQENANLNFMLTQTQEKLSKYQFK